MNYHHTQRGTVIIASMGIIIAVLLVLCFTVGSVDPAVVGIALFTILVMLLFVSLTVEIKSGIILLFFGPGLIRKRIELSDVREVRSVHNSWMMGWGIRWWPGRWWMWNVSGLEAVELTLANGKKFRIGTDEPDELVRAVTLNLSDLARPPAQEPGAGDPLSEMD